MATSTIMTADKIAALEAANPLIAQLRVEISIAEKAGIEVAELKKALDAEELRLKQYLLAYKPPIKTGIR